MSVEDRFKKAVYMIRNGPARESSNEEKLKVCVLLLSSLALRPPRSLSGTTLLLAT